MAIGRDQDFLVEIKQRGLVNATGLPIQEHWLPLSNLDKLLPAVDFGILFIYGNHNFLEARTSPSSIAKKLRKSLGEALVTFYVLAGEVVESSARGPQLLCNNRGVEFIEACADVAIVDLDLHNAEGCLEGKLVPRKVVGVLCIQTIRRKTKV